MKEYDLCKYFFDCPVSKKSNRDCIYEVCQVQKFYDRFGVNYLDIQNERNNIKVENQRRSLHP